MHKLTAQFKIILNLLMETAVIIIEIPMAMKSIHKNFNQL